TGADTPLRRDNRMHAAIQHFAERVDDGSARAGKTLGERVRAQQNHAAGHIFSERLADARGVRAHKIDLELADGIRRNVQVCEFSDAGVHRIRDAIVFNQVVDYGARAVNGKTRSRLQQDGTPLVNDLAHIVKHQIVAVDVKSLHESLKLLGQGPDPLVRLRSGTRVPILTIECHHTVWHEADRSRNLRLPSWLLITG